MEPAPIIIFVYNRLWHTRQTVEALAKNELASDSDLIIFSDGPKTGSDAETVKAVRDYIHGIKGFKNVQIIERKTNWGLAKSIISGVTEIVHKYGKVIVMEDDLVTSPYFLRYINDGLNMYEHESRIASIHGYVYPLKRKVPNTFFIKGADCWGWATWKRAWDFFEPDGRKLLSGLQERNLGYEFNFNDTNSYRHMLKEQIKGHNNSWAVRWYASAFLRDMLTLYPSHTLVENIGFDDTGVNSTARDSSKFNSPISEKPVGIVKLPIQENKEARKAFSEFFLSLRPSLISRVGIKMRKILKI